MKTPRRTRRALLGLATAVSMALLLLTTALAGVSEVTGGSGTTVETTVRNNYTDLKREMLFQLKDGENTFPNAGSFVGDGSADQQGTMPVKFDKLATVVEIAYTVTEDTVVMTVTNYGDLPDGVYDRTLAEDKTLMRTKYTGSDLTYTGTTYDDGGILGGSGTGKATIHEIRTDYYDRTHIYTDSQRQYIRRHRLRRFRLRWVRFRQFRQRQLRYGPVRRGRRVQLAQDL